MDYHGQLLHLISNDKINYQNKTMTLHKIYFDNNNIQIQGICDIVCPEQIIIEDVNFDINNLTYLEQNFCSIYNYHPSSKIPFKLFLKFCDIVYNQNDNRIYINLKNNNLVIKNFCLMNYSVYKFILHTNDILLPKINMVFKIIYLDTNERRFLTINNYYINLDVTKKISESNNINNIKYIYFDFDFNIDEIEIFNNNNKICDLDVNQINDKATKINNLKCFFIKNDFIGNNDAANLLFKINKNHVYDLSCNNIYFIHTQKFNFYFNGQNDDFHLDNILE